MTPSPWIAYSFAALMIVTAGYCVSRLAASWRRHRPTDQLADAMHVLMGLAMAGMLVPLLRVYWTEGWEGLFVVAGASFGWLAVREWRSRPRVAVTAPHHLHHLLACGAMVFMLAGGGTGDASARGTTMTSSPSELHTLSLVLALGLLACVVWTADRLSSLAPVSALGASGRRAPMSLRLEACCEIAMGVTMAYMLIAMY